jgi:acetyltransferase-like isoleucine patch superfamily enzyme
MVQSWGWNNKAHPLAFYKSSCIYPWTFTGFFLQGFSVKVVWGQNWQWVNIKPSVNIKYPWLLEVGDHVWIGEEVWIDNLAKVRIGSNVCISQGAMLLTGNHDFTKSTFRPDGWRDHAGGWSMDRSKGGGLPFCDMQFAQRFGREFRSDKEYGSLLYLSR